LADLTPLAARRSPLSLVNLSFKVGRNDKVRFGSGPALYDRLMRECYRGGLKSPRIVQEGLNEATILSLVSTGLGVGWVLASARWRCPQGVTIVPVLDLNVTVRFALAWRRDNTSSLLARFIVRRLPDVRAVNKG
jgi:DNA-binding transcriptional LysR family regulator